jgi:hypothetical protein
MYGARFRLLWLGYQPVDSNCTTTRDRKALE